MRDNIYKTCPVGLPDLCNTSRHLLSQTYWTSSGPLNVTHLLSFFLDKKPNSIKLAVIFLFFLEMCILIDCTPWSSRFKSLHWVNAIESCSYNATPPPYVFSIQITALFSFLAQKLAEKECVEGPWHLP